MVTWLIAERGWLDIGWLIFLLALLWHFLREKKMLAQTQFWLITKGHIDQFEWVREGVHLWPKIEYSYQVFEHNFHSERLFLDTVHNNPNSKYARGVAYRAAVAYENNADIDVYYNPNNPQDAVLDIKMPSKLNIIIALLLGLIVLHLLIIGEHLLT